MCFFAIHCVITNATFIVQLCNFILPITVCIILFVKIEYKLFMYLFPINFWLVFINCLDKLHAVHGGKNIKSSCIEKNIFLSFCSY